MDFSSVNWLAIAVAVVANMILGYLWYGPLFGKAWMAGLGKNEADLQGGSPAMYVIPMLATVFSAFVLGHVMEAFGDTSIAGGLTAAFWMWLGFSVLTSLTNAAFEGKSNQVWLINTGHTLVGFMIAGTLLGMMG